MTISSADAAAALHDAGEVGRRTRAAGAYRAASPHLLLWGAVWIAGFGASGLVPPERWAAVWLPLIASGSAGAWWLARRARGARGRRAEPGARPAAGAATSMLLSLAIALFMACVYLVFRPATPTPFLVFPALLMGIIYLVLGVVADLRRFAWIGAGVFAATMASYLFLEPWLAFCLAVVGFGGLVLGGLWLRKV